MKELAAAAFLSQFKRDLILVQGFVSFILLAAWLAACWGSLAERMKSSASELAWVGFCLLFGAFFGTACALEWGSEYLLMALSLGLSIGLAMCDPSVAIGLFTSLVFLRPWELIENDDYLLMLPKLTFGICLAHLLLHLASRRKIELRWDRMASCILAYGIWTYATTVKAPDMLGSQALWVDTFFRTLFLYFMILNILITRRQIDQLLTTIILTFASVGMISIYQTFGLAWATQDGSARLTGIGAYANANDTAALMVMVFPFSLSLAVRQGCSRIARAVGALSVAVVVLSIYLSQSRGAVLGIAAILVAYALLRIKNRKLVTLIVAGSLLALPAYTALSNRDSADLEESSASRKVYMEAGMWMGIKNPVLGVGFGAFPANLVKYARSPLTEMERATAHSSWVLAFAEGGLLGLALFAAIAWFSGQAAWGVVRESPELFLSLLGFMITITFLSLTYSIPLYLLAGLIGARRKAPQELPAPPGEAGAQAVPLRPDWAASAP